ncbi:hypothetical protein [Fulvimarina sp. MAC8]
MKTAITAAILATLSIYASAASAGGLVPGSETNERMMEEMTRSDIARGK